VQVRLLDLDGSLMQQQGLLGRCHRPQIVALQDLAPSLRLWGSAQAMQDYADRLAASPPSEHGPDVTFIGSGDFHHLTTALLARQTEPISLIHFDNHPDCVRFPPRWHCGSWINRALELPMIHKIVTLGPCSDDLVWPQLKGLNLRAVRQGQLELWPWRHPPSRLLSGGYLEWLSLGDHPDWLGILDEILLRLPTKRVWISLDKDVLQPDDAVTNWDQGQMPLAALLAGLRRIAQRCQVVGIDICGDYSPVVLKGWWRKFSAWLDHPPQPDHKVWSRNDLVNCRLLDVIAGMKS